MTHPLPSEKPKRLALFTAATTQVRTIGGIARPISAWLKRLYQGKHSPVYQLSLLDMVEPRRQQAFQPVAKRLCYILHNSLPYSSGGYATRSHGVARGLASAGYEPIIITRPGFPIDIKKNLDAGIPGGDRIDGLDYLRLLAPLSKGRPLQDYVSQSAAVLEDEFRRLRPEVVIAASTYRIGLMALIAARRLGIPFIYEVRGWWELIRMSREPGFAKNETYLIQRLLESETAKQADHVFTLNEAMGKELISQGVSPEKIDLLPNSCDPARFLPGGRDERLAASLGIPAGLPVIGYVGTFVDYEGLEDLAKACALLKSRGAAFRLLLVGNENPSDQRRGRIAREITRLANQHRFADWLIMPGRIPHDSVESYYSLIDIAPFPRKPWPVCEMVSPMKPLEALAMEKAVVVSSVAALKEMVQHGGTGLVFEKGKVESLADSLQRLIEDPALRTRLGKAGRLWVEQERTWVRTGKKAADAIHRLLEKNPARDGGAK